MFALLAIAGDDGGLRINVTGVPSAAVDDARTAWLPRVLFVLVPFFAWLVSLARRSSGRHYPAHLVFALHFHAPLHVRARDRHRPWLCRRDAPGRNIGVPGLVLVTLTLALFTAYGVPLGRAIRTPVVAGRIYGSSRGRGGGRDHRRVFPTVARQRGFLAAGERLGCPSVYS